jgi:hypothetical protein
MDTDFLAGKYPGKTLLGKLKRMEVIKLDFRRIHCEVAN